MAGAAFVVLDEFDKFGVFSAQGSFEIAMKDATFKSGKRRSIG